MTSDLSFLAWREISAYFSRLPIPIRDMLREVVYTLAVENIKSNIRMLERDCKTLTDYFNLIQKVRLLSLTQKKYEILCLLEKSSGRGLRFITEIGTDAGGTFYLLCKAANAKATLITLDINMPLGRKRLLKSFAQPGQTVIIVKADSHKQDTVERVIELLHGNKLDLLFIDGDHSYNGVKQDFLNFSSLVRKGGWIVLHDIVSDYRTRYGICAGSWTGGVPKFWSEIKHNYRHFEIVENPNQDGFGIGVLIWNTARDIA